MTICASCKHDESRHIKYPADLHPCKDCLYCKGFVESSIELRFNVDVAGGHSHVAVFVGPDRSHLAKCGDIVFRNEEWDLIAARIHLITEDGRIITTVSRSLT